MVRKVYNDSWLRGRAPREYSEAARLIGAGDMSRGLRIAVREAAQRRGISLDGGAPIPEKGGEFTKVVSALYHGGSPLITAMRELKFPSYVHEIARRAGARKDVTTWRLEELSALGLVREKPSSGKGRDGEPIYYLTDAGKYVAAVIETVERELPRVREEGMEDINAYKLSLLKHLSGKKADIQSAVEKITNTADLMKSSTEALLRLLS